MNCNSTCIFLILLADDIPTLSTSQWLQKQGPESYEHRSLASGFRGGNFSRRGASDLKVCTSVTKN